MLRPGAKIRAVEGSSIGGQERDSKQKKRLRRISARGACGQIPEGLLEKASPIGLVYGVGLVVNAEHIIDVA